MDFGLIGAVAGFALALVECVVLLVLARRIQRRVATKSAPRTARILRIVAVLGLVLATGFGYIVGRAFG